MLQKVVHGFHPYTDGSQGAVLIQIAERDVRLTGALDNFFDGAADERIVPAFEIREFHEDQVGIAGDKVSCPWNRDIALRTLIRYSMLPRT